jgi:hypothetical protein
VLTSSAGSLERNSEGTERDNPDPNADTPAYQVRERRGRQSQQHVYLITAVRAAGVKSILFTKL